MFLASHYQGFGLDCGIGMALHIATRVRESGEEREYVRKYVSRESGEERVALWKDTTETEMCASCSASRIVSRPSQQTNMIQSI